MAGLVRSGRGGFCGFSVKRWFILPIHPETPIGKGDASLTRSAATVGQVTPQRQSWWQGIFASWRSATDIPFALSEVHCFERLGKRVLFHVDSLHFFEVSPLVWDLVHAYRSGDPDPPRALVRSYPRQEIRRSLEELRQANILRPVDEATSTHRPRLRRRAGIRHLEFMVTHACNMRCRYCYGSDEHEGWQETEHLYGASESGMSWETAKRGVDFLFEASGPQKDLSIIFFGGEPLLEFKLIRQVVEYAREKEQESGKKVTFSLSSNGIGLTEKVVEFLVANHIGCQISIDGPQWLHDRNRLLASGKGSYDRVMQGVKRLMARRPGRVPARVTVSNGAVDLPEVADHLLNLGFGSIHVEPVVGGCGSLAIGAEDLSVFKKQTETLAHYLIRRVREGQVFSFSNLVRHVRHSRLIDQRLAYYCGAGRSYFALAQDGAFYPCHRFVGMPAYRMGDLDQGFDDALQRRILDLTVDARPGCRDCWARYLCGGGCWKHAVDINGSLEHPDTKTSCELIRHQIECAMAINTELKVSDRELLGDGYDKTAEPYAVPKEEV